MRWAPHYAAAITLERILSKNENKANKIIIIMTPAVPRTPDWASVQQQFTSGAVKVQ